MAKKPRIKKQYAIKESLFNRMKAVSDITDWGWFTHFLDDAVESKLLKMEGRQYPYFAKKDGTIYLFDGKGTCVNIETAERLICVREESFKQIKMEEK